MTDVDQLHAIQYAINMLNKEICENPGNTLLKKICKSDVNCFKWEKDDSLRMWPHICKTDTTKPCLDDNECFQGQTCHLNPDDDAGTQKYCGFCTLKQEAGHCKFRDENSCKLNSQFPYNCDDNGNCTDIDSSKLARPYLEWRSDTSQCIYGNFILKKYAEDPRSRPNLTDKDLVHLPAPFRYDDTVGKAYITPDYCDGYGVEYGSGKCEHNSDCNQNGRSGGICHNSMDSDSSILNPYVCSNTDCTSNSQCIAPDVCIKGKCNGKSSNCYTNTGEDIGEMILGKTVFNLFNSPVCLEEEIINNILPSNILKSVMDVIKKSPDSIFKLADSRFMKDKKIIGKDFAGKGINMYIIEWKPESGIIPVAETGYDSYEVAKLYPHLVVNKDGKKYISISKSQINNDNNIKRLFLSLNSSKWVMENITHALKNKK